MEGDQQNQSLLDWRRDAWRHDSKRISYSTLGVSLCSTYDPQRQYSGGKDSEVPKFKLSRTALGISLVTHMFQLIVYLDSSKFRDLFVFVHEPKQNIFIPRPLYGSAFFQLPFQSRIDPNRNDT